MPAEFLPIAHPALVGKPPEGPGWVHEIKFDGWRMQLNGPTRPGPPQGRCAPLARQAGTACP